MKVLICILGILLTITSVQSIVCYVCEYSEGLSSSDLCKKGGTSIPTVQAFETAESKPMCYLFYGTILNKEFVKRSVEEKPKPEWAGKCIDSKEASSNTIQVGKYCFCNKDKCNKDPPGPQGASSGFSIQSAVYLLLGAVAMSLSYFIQQ